MVAHLNRSRLIGAATILAKAGYVPAEMPDRLRDELFPETSARLRAKKAAGL